MAKVDTRRAQKHSARHAVRLVLKTAAAAIAEERAKPEVPPAPRPMLRAYHSYLPPGKRFRFERIGK